MQNSKHISQNTKKESGIALLVSVIFMSVVLAIGLTLGSLGYKQMTLASTEISSQKAFYAADAALECVLFADQQALKFSSSVGGNTSGSIKCNGVDVDFSAPTVSVSGDGLHSWNKYTMTMKSLDTNACARVTVYKAQSSATGNTTYLFSSGYNNADCSIFRRTVVRGIDMQYTYF